MSTKIYAKEDPRFAWIQDTSERARALIIEAVETATTEDKERFDRIDEVMGHLVTSYIVARSANHLPKALRMTQAFTAYLTGSVPMMVAAGMDDEN